MYHILSVCSTGCAVSRREVREIASSSEDAELQWGISNHMYLHVAPRNIYIYKLIAK
jgi:hypothetical protein